MIMISCLIDWFQVYEWHGLNTRIPAPTRCQKGRGPVLTKFSKSLWRFSGKNILIHHFYLWDKLINFIWVFVVDEFDEWLTSSPRGWASRVRLSSNSSTTHFYFYCFMMLFIYTFCYCLVLLLPLEFGG